MNEPLALHDSPLRSILKCTTYRLLGTLSTAAIAWVITGQVQAALTIGGIEFFSKFALYYVHERAWARIPLGTVRRLPEKIAERRLRAS